jgi:cytochrome c-type biogenesis protein
MDIPAMQGTVPPVKMLRLLLLPLVLVAAACDGAEKSQVLSVPLKDVTGAQQLLADRADEVLVVNFWASYCKPCIREMPDIEEVASEFPAVTFVGVNALDDVDKALEMVAETGVTYEILFDERGDAMSAAGVRSLPATMIFVAGEKVFNKLGEISGDQLRDELEALAVTP